MSADTWQPARIIDAHHHLWNPVSSVPDVGYVWLRDIGAPKPFGDPTQIQRDYLLEEFLEEASPIRLSASVHVQADGAIPDPVAETRFIDELASVHRHKIGIVGFVDLSADNAAGVIEAHKSASPLFKGVRQILSRLEGRPDISFAQTDHVREDSWRERFGLLGEHGLSFDLQCYPEQMHEIAEFLAKHPKIPVILDHAGSPWNQSPDGLEVWRTGMASLAALPHVSVKLSGFGMFDRTWNAASIRPIFQTITELFGPQRMMFASNFPVDKLMRPYSAIVEDMNILVAGWDSKDVSAFFEANARQTYRLDQS